MEEILATVDRINAASIRMEEIALAALRTLELMEEMENKDVLHA